MTCPLHKHACPECAKGEKSASGWVPPPVWQSYLQNLMLDHYTKMINPPIFIGWDLGKEDKAVLNKMSVPGTGWFSLKIKEKPVSEAVKRADQVKSDVARLEGEVARITKVVDEKDREISRLRQAPITEQRMLLVYRDGRIENRPLYLQPDPARLYGGEPARYFETVDAPLYPIDPYTRYEPMPSRVTKRSFMRVHEQAPDAKLVVYTER